MKFLLDTDALSEPARRRPSAGFLAHLRRHQREIAISAISVGEVTYGAHRVAGGQRYLDYLRDAVLPHVPVLPLDVPVLTVYGELRALLEKRGTPLADLDLLIAATARAHDLPLVTGNQRHFARVPGLVLADWFSDRKPGGRAPATRK